MRFARQFCLPVFAGLTAATALLVSLTLLAGASLTWLDKNFPPDLSRYDQRSQEVLAADGQYLHRFLIGNGLLRLPADLKSVDPAYLKMLLAYEDKRFWQHGGVDFRALIRAGLQTLRNGRVVSGASTISMQTARLLEPKARNLRGKLIEMFRAWQLERRYGKQKILTIYMTLAPFGGNIEGVRAAALSYFGREPKQLTPDEAALLVALPRSPTRLRPDRNAAAAKRARNKVLRRIAGRIALSPSHLRLALKAPVPKIRRPNKRLAAHLATRLMAGDDKGGKIRTSINADLQARFESLARKTAVATHHKATAAILVADIRSRQVLAYVGSALPEDEARHGYVDMVRALRSPGSTLKPMIYGLAFERGLGHPETLIRDVPRRFGGYAPHNFQDKHYGRVAMREALQRSLNVPAVAVLNRLGPVNFTEHLRQAGMTLKLAGNKRPGLAVALGGIGTSLEDLTRLYAAIAGDGKFHQLCFHPDSASCGKEKTSEILSREARGQVARILRGTRPPKHLLAERFMANPRGIAFKTGTSYGFRDAWVVGFDARHVVGVWVGRPDGTPLPGRFGANTAAPLLFQIFAGLPQGEPQSLPTDADRASGKKLAVAKLPPALKFFDRPDRVLVLSQHSAPPPEITFPPNRGVISLAGAEARLTLNIEGGQRPLFWFLNNRPMGENRWSRDFTWTPREPGFHTITVIDALGQKTSSNFQLQLD